MKKIFKILILVVLGSLFLYSCKQNDDKIKPIQQETQTYKLTLPNEVKVIKPENLDLEKILKDTKVTIEVTIPENKLVDNLLVNNAEKELSNNQLVLSITSNTTVSVTFKDKPISSETFSLTLPSEVSVVQPQNLDLSKVAKDTQVTLKVTLPTGKQVDKLLVNNAEKQLSNNQLVLTITSNSTVTVTFKDKPAEAADRESLELRFINQETNINPDSDKTSTSAKYKILDNSIVSVSNTGVLKALKQGSTKVEVTYNNTVTNIDVTVLNGSRRHVDVDYKTNLKLDVIEPSVLVYKKSPTIIFVHGGSWIAGDKTNLYSETQAKTYPKLSTLGYTVVTINYRLGDQSGNTFPQNIEDVKDSVRFIRQNATTYNVDPNNIGLWGTSAGAHLVLMSAYTHDDKFSTTTFNNVSSKVNYVVAINPVYDLVEMINDPYTSQSDKVTLARMLFNLDFNSLTQENLNTINSYFPVTNMKQGLVPTIIFHGKKDHTVSYQQSVNLEKALKDNNNIVELNLYDNTDHGLVVFQSDPKTIDNKVANDVVSKTVKFVIKYYKK